MNLTSQVAGNFPATDLNYDPKKKGGNEDG